MRAAIQKVRPASSPRSVADRLIFPLPPFQSGALPAGPGGATAEPHIDTVARGRGGRPPQTPQTAPDLWIRLGHAGRETSRFPMGCEDPSTARRRVTRPVHRIRLSGTWSNPDRHGAARIDGCPAPSSPAGEVREVVRSAIRRTVLRRVVTLVTCPARARLPSGPGNHSLTAPPFRSRTVAHDTVKSIARPFDRVTDSNKTTQARSRRIDNFCGMGGGQANFVPADSGHEGDFANYSASTNWISQS